MERSQPPLASWTPYGTTVLKQVYIYGALDFSPTVIDRKFGLTWSVGGYLLTNALARLGGEAIGRMRTRVLAEAKTTFSSGYAQTIGLRDVLQPEVLTVFARRSTGTKYLIDPTSDRSIRPIARRATAAGVVILEASQRTVERSSDMADTDKAILAGGCFWGMQDLIRKLDGVTDTRVGYTGGDVPNATYRNHGTHAEAIEILFDPERITYRDLLEFFFQIHDPTTKNRQGNDVGMSYRSAIYYVNDEQRQVAQDTIADVDASGLWPGKVVTEVEPAGPFWEAEPEHQDYLERYPNGYTCHFVRPNWVLPKRAAAE